MNKSKEMKSNPARILELSGKYWESFALHTAVELDIFTLLDEEGMTIDEIASFIEQKRNKSPCLRFNRSWFP